MKIWSSFKHAIHKIGSSVNHAVHSVESGVSAVGNDSVALYQGTKTLLSKTTHLVEGTFDTVSSVEKGVTGITSEFPYVLPAVGVLAGLYLYSR